MLKDYLNQLNGQVDNDVSFFNSGINSYNDKAFIDINQMPYAVNVTVTEPPLLCTRASRKHLIATPDLGQTVKIWVWNESNVFAIVKEGNTLKLYLFKYNNGTWEITMLDDTLIGIPYFCYCKDGVAEYLYVSNPFMKGKLTLANSSQAIQNSYERLDDNHYGIPSWHKGRMFFADPTKRIITYSALFDYDNFTEVPADPDPDIDYSSYAGDFLVTNSVGNITMIVSFDDRLVIFCQHSMHLLYGDTPLINSSSQFQLVDLNNNLGCQAPKSVAIGGGYLFWLGDDCEIYSYSGSSIDVITRPMSSRYVTRAGGINKKYILPDVADATATSNKYYICINSPYFDWESIMLVYDTLNRVWWAEDGDFRTIANISTDMNNIAMVSTKEEIMKTTQDYTGYDYLWNFSKKELEYRAIKYEFHTKVFGADGVNRRESIDKIWFQASANAKVYLSDSWTSTDSRLVDERFDKEIGTLKYKGQKSKTQDYLETYDSSDYEQQVCYVQKMYGQRLNTFQIKIKGSGPCKFYLMKREWDAR